MKGIPREFLKESQGTPKERLRNPQGLHKESLREPNKVQKWVPGINSDASFFEFGVPQATDALAQRLHL